MVNTASLWLPDRQDIIWIDCNPQVGQEMRDIHPFLVLSPRIFNDKTSLVIGLPMTTAEYNADNPFAVAVGKHRSTCLMDVVSRHATASQTIWVDDKAHNWFYQPCALWPLFVQVCERLNQIIQLVVRTYA